MWVYMQEHTITQKIKKLKKKTQHIIQTAAVCTAFKQRPQTEP